MAPAVKRRASAREVLPEPPWPTRATLRIFSVGNVFAATGTPGNSQAFFRSLRSPAGTPPGSLAARSPGAWRRSAVPG